MEIRKIGVVGFGTMGAGIAQVCAHAGYPVIVSEINPIILDKCLATFNNTLTKGVKRGQLSAQDKEAIQSRISGTVDIDDFYDCDLIIEAAIEDLSLKKNIMAEMDKICKNHTILATNTSCLSIIDMAVNTSRPDKLLGLHFFNPVQLMALIEIVPTILTSDETIETCKVFCESLGRTVVVAKDAPGFIVNRLAMPFILNAIKMLESGVASRDDIDKAVQLGLNHPMGPLALADLIGLDVVYYIVNSLYEEFKDPQYAPPILLKKSITAGYLGRKTGKGFYEYSKNY